MKAIKNILIKNKLKALLTALALVIAYVSSLGRGHYAIGGEFILLMVAAIYWTIQIEIESERIDEEEAYKKMIKRNQVL
ncbi:MAG: hypothetical protein RSA49_05110 [Anaerovoracaceae bacterium]